ncbi:uncharacterized protein L201_001460 [Kwoniella dendrophila CBS 6074]|uniref:Zn(2)-C6 fungal-type domain-containing protein n=1 Tax=Kwoniella dendrophila CBS 6074 TaxID=1295534 RepID=A0AAX4JNX4_9TREE
MHSHIPDTTYADHAMRQFRGVPLGGTQPRGTMSMPNSPIMGRINDTAYVSAYGHGGQIAGNDSMKTDVWNSTNVKPHTAQGLSSLQSKQKITPHFLNHQQHHQVLPSCVSPIEIAPRNSDIYNNQRLTKYNRASIVPEFSPKSTAYASNANASYTNVANYNISPTSTHHILPNKVKDPNNTDAYNLPVYTNHTSNLNYLAPPPLNTTIQPPIHYSYTQGGYGNDNDLDNDIDMNHDTSSAGGRKKRVQVRIACTHCQKACKKCSNTRPCERCVKYGLEDCVDSTRKPRKTGVKRGPYKRRSMKYSTIGTGGTGEYSSSNNNNINSSSSTYLGKQIPAYSQDQKPQTLSQLPKSHNPYSSNISANHYFDDATTTDNSNKNHKRNYNNSDNTDNLPKRYTDTETGLTKLNDNMHDQLTSSTTSKLSFPLPLPNNLKTATIDENNNSYPPFPKSNKSLKASNPSISNTNNLLTALNNALSLPQQSQWINGERLNFSSTNGNGNGNGKASPLYPKTPVMPFPISLNGFTYQNNNEKQDPFSRAVSPIKQFQKHGSSGLSYDSLNSRTSNNNNTSTDHTRIMNTDENAHYQMNNTATILSDNIHENGRRYSIFNNTYDNDINHIQNTDIFSPIHSISANTPTFTFPSNIRRPNIRTLISSTTNSSRASSPVGADLDLPSSSGGPLSAIQNQNQYQIGLINQQDSELQSPTLFNGNDAYNINNNNNNNNNIIETNENEKEHRRQSINNMLLDEINQELDSWNTHQIDNRDIQVNDDQESRNKQVDGDLFEGLMGFN